MTGTARARVRRGFGTCTALVATALVVVTALVGGSAQTSAAAENAFYVAPDGDDANAGTLEAPFRTLERARDAVREINSNMSGDIHVYLRGGSYPIESTVEFGPEDSGTDGHRVIYSAFENETPVLETGTEITGWTQHDGSIWSAPLDRADKLRALYVDDRRAVMAYQDVRSQGCYGEYTVTAGQAPWAWESGTECDGAMYALADVPEIDDNVEDIEIQTATTWTTAIVGVRDVTTSEDGASRVLLLQQPGAAIAAGAFNGNFQIRGNHKLMNAYEFLDEPGEFYYDRTAKTVYYYKAASEDMAAASVFAPNGVQTALRIAGTSRTERVHDLSFEGITVRHTDWNLADVDGASFKQAQQGNIINSAYVHGNFHVYHYRNVDLQPAAIEVTSAANISFERNRVEHTGADGISLINDVVDSQLTGNVTRDVGGTAINIGHPQHVYIGDATADNKEKFPADVEGAPTNIQITNNYVYESAQLFLGSAAVAAYFVDTLAFEHNVIEKTSWAGISMGWGWWNFNGSPGSIEPGNPTTVARNNSIRYNTFIDTVNDRNDTGPVYTLGAQPDTVISHNYIDGVRAGHTYGLHADEASAYITFDSNVLDISEGVTYTINSEDWGSKHHLTVTNTWATVWNKYANDPPDSLIEPIMVFPDGVWPLEGYAVTVNSGLEPAYRDLLGPGATLSPDHVLPSSVEVDPSVASIPIRGTGDESATIWLAPEGTTRFAAGDTMTTATGDATSIAVPRRPGTYRLFVVTASGDVAASTDLVRRSGPLEVSLTADPATLDAGGSTVVTASIENLTGDRLSGLRAAIDVPEGWSAVRAGKPVSPVLAPGATASASWTVTAPASFSEPVSRATIEAALTVRYDGMEYAEDRSLTLTALNPLTSLNGYGSVASRFAEAGSGYAILTSGTDMWQDGAGSFDEYGAIYDDDAVGQDSTVTARVTHLDDTNAWAKAGVVIRNDVTAAGASAGYAVMVVTPGNGVSFQWDANGNGYLDSVSSVGGVRAPAWVRLVRSGNDVSGYYSIDGTTWTKVGPTVALAGIAATQDGGLVATSHAAGVTGQFSFTDFSVS
ncbi:right-handed parallel beta-helix repeat-containing protein [Jiangella rhizosphaerae]|uniref:Right-handed parallel beta-helix repeat-containing protein n=1 Tax=Jiangella rhizosphaerae TaxID=2293569 RepID=A0A418KLZ2_9ACTN|nr:right-handed parallel beta-helix repeat-containing protein [Jiangella rhizosphaerae]RIQ18964.1 right-handed parallel beta-helix repeat-containing protein [Jiangella rhizosphaerae]